MKTRDVKVFDLIIKDNESRKVFTAYGKFHQFATDYDEFLGEPAQYPVAIVEMSDGTVQSVPSELIQFINEEKSVKEIQRADFTKGSYWATICPSCGDSIETISEPRYEDQVYCDGCDTNFKLVE